MTDSTRLVTNSQRIAPTRTESVLKVRFVQYGRHRRLTNESNITILVNRAIDEGKLPKVLYKYRTLNGTKKILTNGTIWFSKLREFNDPFEGQAIIQDNYTEEQWYYYLLQNGCNPSVASKKARELVTDDIQEARTIVRTAIDNQSKNNWFLLLIWSP